MHSLYQLVRPLTVRNFRYLWLGQSISTFGSAVRTIAIIWLVLQQTHSSLDLSIALLAVSVPRIIFLLVGGALTDRYNQRQIIIWCDAARTLITIMIVVFAFTNTLYLPVLYALLTIHGFASGIALPAEASIIPSIVPVEQLQHANSLGQFTPQIATVLGAPIGGFLVGLIGPVPALVFNAVTYAFSVYFTVKISKLDFRNMPNETPNLWISIGEGIKYVTKYSWILIFLILDAVSNFAFSGPYTVGLPIFTKHLGAQSYGVLIAGFSIGSLIGLLVSGVMHRPRRPGLAICLMTLFQAPLVAIMCFVPFPWEVLLLTFDGIFNGVSGVLYITIIQEQVNSQMLGRVLSLLRLASLGLQPISQLVTGVIIQDFSVPWIFFAAGVFIAISALLGLSAQSIRTLHDNEMNQKELST